MGNKRTLVSCHTEQLEHLRSAVLMKHKKLMGSLIIEVDQALEERANKIEKEQKANE